MTEQEVMLTSILNCRRIDLMTDREKLTDQQQSLYDQMLTRRADGEPLQYIVGSSDFIDIPLTITSDVLIPRPETEILVEHVIQEIKRRKPSSPFNVLELGTGSGNISIALAKNISNASITSIDISSEALALASRNAIDNGVSQQIDFLHQDMNLFLSDAVAKKQKFDVIISNPPYIPTAQLKGLPADVQQEPQIALDGGSDGLYFYKIISRYSHQILRSKGVIFLEIGDGQREDICMLFNEKKNYQQTKLYQDYVGTDRIVYIQSH